MKTNRLLILMVTGMLLHACTPDTRQGPTHGTLTMGSCASESPLAENFVSEFMRQYPETQVDLRALESDSLVGKFVSGELQAMLLDRELDEVEASSIRRAGIPMQSIRVGREGIALLASDRNALGGLSLSALDSIITGKIARCDALSSSALTTAITVCLPGTQTGLYRSLWKRFSLGEHAASRVLRYRNTEELLRYMADDPGALAFTSADVLDSLPAGVHALRIAWVDSTGTWRDVPLHQAHVYEGTYPLTIPVMYYFRGGSNHVGTGLAAFISSNPGQTIVLKSGRAPASIPVRVVHLKPNDGAIE